MKIYLTIIAIIAGIFTLSHCMGGEKNEKNDDRRRVADQLLDSLKDDNIIAYAQCWISSPMAYRLAVQDKMPAGMLKKQHEHLLARDRAIAKIFQPLREVLLDLTGDLTKLEIESVSGPIEEHDDTHILVSDKLIVKIRVNANTIVEWELSGIKIADEWCFAGKPKSYVTVTRNGKAEELDLTHLLVERRQIKQEKGIPTGSTGS